MRDAYKIGVAGLGGLIVGGAGLYLLSRMLFSTPSDISDVVKLKTPTPQKIELQIPISATTTPTSILHPSLIIEKELSNIDVRRMLLLPNDFPSAFKFGYEPTDYIIGPPECFTFEEIQKRGDYKYKFLASCSTGFRSDEPYQTFNKATNVITVYTSVEEAKQAFGEYGNMINKQNVTIIRNPPNIGDDICAFIGHITSTEVSGFFYSLTFRFGQFVSDIRFSHSNRSNVPFSEDTLFTLGYKALSYIKEELKNQSGATEFSVFGR